MEFFTLILDLLPEEFIEAFDIDIENGLSGLLSSLGSVGSSFIGELISTPEEPIAAE